MKKDVPQEGSPSLLQQRDGPSPAMSPVGVTTETSPTPERELTPVLGAVAAKPKAVAQLLSARKMSTFIVSSLSTPKPDGNFPKEGKDSEGAVSGDVILTLTDVTREFPLEDDDRIVTMALGQTHSVFATGETTTCSTRLHLLKVAIYIFSVHCNFAGLILALYTLVMQSCLFVCVSVCLLCSKG